jgi:hypothetical protein
MRYVVSGRLRDPVGLSPREYVALAIREWALVLDWLRAGTALGYGRVGGASGTLVLSCASAAEAAALARSLPFAPYAEMRVTPVPDPEVRAPGRQPRAGLAPGPDALAVGGRTGARGPDIPAGA